MRAGISHWKQAFNVEDAQARSGSCGGRPGTTEAGGFITLPVCFVFEEEKKIVINVGTRQCLKWSLLFTYSEIPRWSFRGTVRRLSPPGEFKG